MTSLNEPSGTRDHLTASQTRILYKLWQRFFRLCDTPADFQSGSGNATASTTQPASGAASTSVLDSGVRAAPSSSSSSVGKQAGPSSPVQGSKTTAATPSSLLHPQSDPNLSRTISSQSGSYGKPIQRQPSRSRQIDDRGGSQIPKDDKVQDELKTMEESKEMREFLEKYGGGKLREVFWDMVKGEHPDAIMLRFLRARKWDIDRAIAVIGSTAAFRVENDVKGIVKGGELLLTKTKGGMKIFANGISYVYGASSIGEPVYFIEVGNHFSHNQTQEELKRGVILLQEWLQMLMPPPIERKVVIFNMNDFGVRNMDWWCVFFMVKTMESYYVETLARVYVHGAPWIFRPIWAILKPLLDPVVRDKIRLTSSPEELADHIPYNHLPKESMRGGMDWKFNYPAPEEDENDIQLDTETHDRLFRQYQQLANEFEASTRQISHLYSRSSLLQRARNGSVAHRDLSSDSELDDEVMVGAARGGTAAAAATTTAAAAQPSSEQPPPQDRGMDLNGPPDQIGADLKAKRDVLATKLRVAFLKLRPYVVGKSKYDRWNVMRSDGSIQWEYETLDGTREVQTLGQGTTLPELERNLDLIDSAQSLSASQSRNSFQLGGDDVDGGNGNAGGSRAQARESNRQKRLRSRTWETQEQQEQRPASQSTGQEGESNRTTASTITPGSSTESNKEGMHFTLAAAAADDKPESEPMPVHPLHST